MTYTAAPQNMQTFWNDTNRHLRIRRCVDGLEHVHVLEVAGERVHRDDDETRADRVAPSQAPIMPGRPKPSAFCQSTCRARA